MSKDSELDGLNELYIRKGNRKPDSFYRLFDKVGEHGVLYFGQDKIIDGNKTSVCICPRCGESWRVILKYVTYGTVKHCGCKES